MSRGVPNAAATAGKTDVTRKTPSAEERLKELGIQLPSPPTPFGSYAEAVRTGNLLFLSGMLPTEGRTAKFVGRAGADFDVETAREAARLAALNGLAVAREYLGSLDKITRIVRLGVSLATTEDCREHPKVADGASDLLQDIFGKDKNPEPPHQWGYESAFWSAGRSGTDLRSGLIEPRSEAREVVSDRECKTLSGF